MTDLEKMKQVVEYNGYKYKINKMYEHIGLIYLEIIGYSNGKRLALFEFDIEGNFKLHN
jgi:hypothetical protein